MSDIDSSLLRVPPDLEHAGANMNAIAGKIHDHLVTLQGQLAPLQDYWQGPAQSYYQELQQEWNVAAEGLLGPNGVMGDIASALNIAWNNYTDAEWANVKTWGGQASQG